MFVIKMFVIRMFVIRMFVIGMFAIGKFECHQTVETNKNNLKLNFERFVLAD